SAASADVDCSKRPKFVDPRTCCPIPEFISAEVKEKCQEYNVTPPPLDQSGEGKRRPYYHHPPPCYMSCVFDKSGVYENSKVDVTKLKDYLQVVYKDNSDLQALTTDAFSACAAKMEEFKKMKSDHPSLCPSTPSFLMGCVFKNMFKDCPATIWTDTQECNAFREHFVNCQPPHRRSLSDK
ncbi:hypothetical protein KR044_004846, partial [Drosophila immigrans]